MKEDWDETKEDYIRSAMDSMHEGNLIGFIMMVPVWYAEDIKNSREYRKARSKLEVA